MKRSETPRQVVWTSSNPPGVEYSVVRREATGWALEGSIVRRFKGKGALLSYRVDADWRWRTREARVDQVLDGKRPKVLLEVRGSRWFVNGKDDSRLNGCVDLASCWVKFPSLKVAPLRQSYERLAKNRYRYSSVTGFSSEIEVDQFGSVRRYGDYCFAVVGG